jgi:hypothetical protein
MQPRACDVVLTAGDATGTDTTAHSLSRAAISMAKYPEWLEKIWEEQQSIIATEGEAITPEVRMYRMRLPFTSSFSIYAVSCCVDTSSRGRFQLASHNLSFQHWPCRFHPTHWVHSCDRAVYCLVGNHDTWTSSVALKKDVIVCRCWQRVQWPTQ